MTLDMPVVPLLGTSSVRVAVDRRTVIRYVLWP